MATQGLILMQPQHVAFRRTYGATPASSSVRDSPAYVTASSTSKRTIRHAAVPKLSDWITGNSVESSLCGARSLTRFRPRENFHSECGAWQKRQGWQVRAATTEPEGLDPTAASDSIPVPEGAVEAVKSPETQTTALLGSLFGLWYLFNIYFNIYNKQVLKVYMFPVTMTSFQFAVGAVIVLVMWGLGLHEKPKVSQSQLMAILPLALVHTLGNLFTNMSLGKVSVSFTHTIKAMEPFFSVLLSAIFLGENPNPLIVASLVPIVGGVALASLTEVSFNWAGFLSAMASNVTFQSRNVLSKKLMLKKEGSLDNINLFSIITIMSFFLLAPVVFFAEGIKFTPAAIQAAGLDFNVVARRALLAAICFHSYQQVSYMILQRVNPVTHSVGNCVKRVVVIVTSVLFFRTPVSPINALGTAVALSGVFAYSRVKALAGKKKAEPKAA